MGETRSVISLSNGHLDANSTNSSLKNQRPFIAQYIRFVKETRNKDQDTQLKLATCEYGLIGLRVGVSHSGKGWICVALCKYEGLLKSIIENVSFLTFQFKRIMSHQHSTVSIINGQQMEDFNQFVQLSFKMSLPFLLKGSTIITL